MANTKLYRSMGQNLQSIQILVNGIFMFIISYKVIQEESIENALIEQEKLREEFDKWKQENANEPVPPKYDDALLNQPPPKKNFIQLLGECENAQKLNFLLIITVFVGQLNKNLYDSIADSFLQELLAPTDYIEINFLYTYNNACMFADCFNIVQGAISLLKYTVKAQPDLQAITTTVTKFMSETFMETITMIMIVYLLFGFLSYYMLAYYQFGFFYVTYALLRSCIVFLNGFIINE